DGGGERAGGGVGEGGEELRDVREAEDRHEGALELRMLGAGGIARRLGEIEIKAEQRRQKIVAEVFRALAHLAREQAFVEQVEKGLVRIERGGDEVLGADCFARARLDTDRAAAFDENARGLGAQVNLAAGLAHRGCERAASAAEPPRAICALAGLASSAAM